jgi:hypothetical protein
MPERFNARGLFASETGSINCVLARFNLEKPLARPVWFADVCAIGDKRDGGKRL